MIVTDTNVLVDLLRGGEQAQKALRLARAEGESIAASVLTKVELLAGMRRGERPRIHKLFGELDWVPVDDVIAQRAGELASRFRTSHAGIEVVDYVVAATAMELGARLWTLNLRHFPMFRELAPPY